MAFSSLYQTQIKSLIPKGEVLVMLVLYRNYAHLSEDHYTHPYLYDATLHHKRKAEACEIQNLNHSIDDQKSFLILRCIPPCLARIPVIKKIVCGNECANQQYMAG